jgi:hypothetical protein
MGMTLTEKILARKTGQAKVSPGDMVTVGVDTVVLVDTMFAPGRWRTIKKLDNPERVIVVLDHRAPTPDKQGAASHQTARKFVEQFGIKRFHDIGYDQGISHHSSRTSVTRCRARCSSAAIPIPAVRACLTVSRAALACRTSSMRRRWVRRGSSSARPSAMN